MQEKHREGDLKASPKLLSDGCGEAGNFLWSLRCRRSSAKAPAPEGGMVAETLPAGAASAATGAAARRDIGVAAQRSLAALQAAAASTDIAATCLP